MGTAVKKQVFRTVDWLVFRRTPRTARMGAGWFGPVLADIHGVISYHLLEWEVALLESRGRQGVADEVVVLVAVDLTPEHHVPFQALLPLSLHHRHLSACVRHGSLYVHGGIGVGFTFF